MDTIYKFRVATILDPDFQHLLSHGWKVDKKLRKFTHLKFLSVAELAV